MPWGKRIEEGKEKYYAYRLGYTGHEQLDNLGLIHMNGRVYDPDIGRFISADPQIQSPLLSQNYARYSYVINNPYKYTDPSGFGFLKKLWKAVSDPFKKIINLHKRIFDEVNSWVKENWREIVTVVAVVAITYFTGGLAAGSFWATGVGTGVAGGFTGGAVGTALYGGSVSEVLEAGLKGAAIGALTGGLTEGWAGDKGLATKWRFSHRSAGRALGHGVIGGTSSALQGGKFMAGFGSAAFTHYATANTSIGGSEGYSEITIERTVANAAIGGTASVIGEGKFANGAAYSAMQSMYSPSGRAVDYSDCGNNQACVVSNEGVKGELDKLNKIMQEGGLGHVSVSGGDSYYDKVTGQSISRSTNGVIGNRRSTSFHHDHRNNRAVDIRSNTINLQRPKIDRYIEINSEL